MLTDQPVTGTRHLMGPPVTTDPPCDGSPVTWTRHVTGLPSNVPAM